MHLKGYPLSLTYQRAFPQADEHYLAVPHAHAQVLFAAYQQRADKPYGDGGRLGGKINRFA